MAGPASLHVTPDYIKIHQKEEEVEEEECLAW